MSKFRKKGAKETPAISTSSLPDIIFMLLFFFMVSTTMRTSSPIVKVKLPKATEVQKLVKKSLVSYILIGPPVSENLGNESRIQLNDSFAEKSNIAEFILAEREARDEADRPFLITSLKVNKTTKMGVVSDVKQELRKVGAFKINYSTLKGTSIDF
ncbi:MAG: biopolymer transporter ExbD [Bacteroidales bacterium]|nr:biopolymer transporter ExbD [Bacteroidales bacterium]